MYHLVINNDESARPDSPIAQFVIFKESHFHHDDPRVDSIYIHFMRARSISNIKMVLQAGQAVYKSRIVCSGTLRKCQVEAIKQIFSRELEEPVFIE